MLKLTIICLSNTGKTLGQGNFGIVEEAVADGIIKKGEKTKVAVKKVSSATQQVNLYLQSDLSAVGLFIIYNMG